MNMIRFQWYTGEVWCGSKRTSSVGGGAECGTCSSCCDRRRRCVGWGVRSAVWAEGESRQLLQRRRAVVDGPRMGRGQEVHVGKANTTNGTQTSKEFRKHVISTNPRKKERWMAVGVKDEECRVKGGECSQGISPAKDRRAYYYTYDDHRTFSYFLVLSRLFIPKKKKSSPQNNNIPWYWYWCA